jgi:hypothetical protein
MSTTSQQVSAARLKDKSRAYYWASLWLFLLLWGSPFLAYGQSITAIASTDWHLASTWSTGVVPTATDDVTIPAGISVTIGTTGITYTCNNLTVDGTLTFEATAARTLTVVQNVTISSTGIFQSAASGTITAHSLSLSGNLTNNGVLDFSTNTNTAGAILTFTGSNNQTVTGTGTTTDLHTIAMSKTSITNIVEFNVSNMSVRGLATGSTNGFLQDNTGTGTVKFSGTNTFSGITWNNTTYTIAATMGVWLNNPNFTVTGQTASPICAGTLRITQGTYNIGTASNNSLAFGTGATLTVEGGTLNSTGRINTANTITFNMSGGDINVSTSGNGLSSTASFGLTSTSNTVNWSGGTVNLVQRNSNATPLDYNVQGSTLNITGGTLQVGTSATATNFDFRIQGNVPQLVLNNATNTKTAQTTGTTTVHLASSITTTLTVGVSTSFNSSLTVPVGGTLALNSTAIMLANLVNEGTISGTGTCTLRFGSSTIAIPQTYSGTAGTCTFTAATNGAVEFFNTNGVTLSHTNQIVTNQVILSAGIITNANKITVGAGAATSQLIQIGANITTIPSGSFDVAPTFNIGTGGLALIYSTCANAVTTGVEIPTVRNIRGLTVNNTNGVTLAGGDLNINVGTPSMTIGTGANISLGNNNLNLGVSGAAATLTLGSTTTSLIVTNGTGAFTRSFAAATIAAGSTGLFPVAASATVDRRVAFSTVGAITTGGTITVRHADASGTTTVGAFTDNGVSIDTRTNASWIISTAGLNLGAQTLSVAVTGSGLYANLFNTTELRLVNASSAIAGSPATFASTGIAPNFIGNRSFVQAELANLSTTIYMGVNSSNIIGATITSINTGNWGDTSTWDTGTVPTASNPVIIASGHNVTLAGTAPSPYSAGNLTVNGTLTANANTLTIGLAGGGNRPLTFATTGAFVLGGSATVNVNGNVIFNGSSTLAMTGGSLNIDGNTGTASSSVANGTHLLNFNNSGSTVASAGTITIVDPPHSSTTTSFAVRIARTSNAFANFAGSTVQFGDGVSTTPGPTANGFIVDGRAGAGARIPLGNVIVQGGNTTDRFLRNPITTTNGIYIAGDLTINAGSEFRTSTSAASIVGGNIVNNGTLTTSNTLTLGGSATTGSTTDYVISTPQTVSGTGIFQNATSSATANFFFLTIRNAGGVTINALNTIGTGSASSDLLLSAGNLTIGTGINFILGIDGTFSGTFNGTAGSGIITNGTATFGRWYGTTGLPTIPGTANGYYPFTTATNAASSPSRIVQLYFSSATALSTAGVIAFNYSDVAGFTDLGSPFSDGVVTVQRYLNPTWKSSTTGVVLTGTMSMQIASTALYYPSDITLMRVTEPTVALGGANGTNTITGTFPNTRNNVQRTGLSLADFTGKTFVLASSIANLPREIQ